MSDSNETKEYSFDEYIPEKDRHYDFKSLTVTWLNANANTSSWYVGSIIGALGLTGAIVASLIANPLSYVLLALIGLMGYKVSTTSMGLARVPFGINGSKLPSFLNAFQYVGWCGVNIYMAAVALSYLGNSFFGLPVVGEENSAIYTIIYIAILTTVMTFLAVKGGSRSIKIAENIAIIGILIVTVWISVVIITSFSMSDIMNWKPAESEAISFGVAFDSIAALAMAWVVAGADYSRYGKTKKVAAAAPFVGANVGMLWLSIVGAISAIALAITNGIYDPDMSDPASICSGLGLGNLAQAMIILSVVAVNLLNIYSGGFCALNISEKIAPKVAMMIIAVGAALLAIVPIVAGSFMTAFQIFLGYLGAVFPPCIAIMVVDYFLIRNQKYEHNMLAKKEGLYWYYKGFNIKAIISWLAGSCFYFVLGMVPSIANSIGCVFGCLVFTAVLYYVLASVGGSKER